MSSSEVARTAAQHLTDLDPLLPLRVEAHLQAGAAAQPPGRYFDADLAIKLASLLVSVAALAWTIYKDLKKSAPAPAPDVVARRIRIAVEVPPGVTDQQRDRIISVVVDETVKRAEAAD